MRHRPDYLTLTVTCFRCGWAESSRQVNGSDLLIAGPGFSCGAGACFGQTRISVGKASKKLSYEDQVLQLVYEDGSSCPSKSGLRYKSVISFVCRPEAGPTSRPVLISLDKQTCTLFFSWHTPLACEQAVSPQAEGLSPPKVSSQLLHS